jgi:hypothetical protein
METNIDVVNYVLNEIPAYLSMCAQDDQTGKRVVFVSVDAGTVRLQ